MRINVRLIGLIVALAGAVVVKWSLPAGLITSVIGLLIMNASDEED